MIEQVMDVVDRGHMDRVVHAGAVWLSVVDGVIDPVMDVDDAGYLEHVPLPTAVCVSVDGRA